MTMNYVPCDRRNLHAILAIPVQLKVQPGCFSFVRLQNKAYEPGGLATP